MFFSIIDQGEKYYWHNGEGVIFDDAYLHDAKNDSDEVRVVMWIDVRRKMPWWLPAFNIAEREVFRAPREPDFDLACGVGFSANVLVLFLPDACVLSPRRGKVS